MDKLFEGLDDDSNLSVKEMKSRLLAYDAEKKKKEDELQNQMTEMTAMLKNLTAGGTLSGASASKESYHDVNHDYPRNTSPMPHINHSGTVPHYDGTHFPHWKSAMESHIRSCSVELWELIVHGHREPQDPTRLTSTEFYNRQLNASARDKIRSGINRKLLDQVDDIVSAKELWDRIVVLQEGTDLIQSSLYETAKQEAYQFMIRDGESVFDAYARLGALKVRVKGLGAEKYNDGFEMNEAFIKSKVIAMIAVKQEDTNLGLNLQIMTKSADLNSDDLVSYVAANENMAKAGKRLKAMNRVDEASHNHEASHNLALKARADHGGEEEYEIEEDEEMTSTSDIATDFAFFAKKYKGKLPMLLNDKKKKRTCYNCDEDSHFANECPYEKRVDKPRFIKGVKPRLKPNPINDRFKKNKGRAFVGAEYLSDDEEEDEEKEAGVAGLAYSKPGSLFTYDYSKDYSTENDVGSSFMARITQEDDSDDSSSSTIVGSCLMARETKVMEPPPSLSSVLDDENENQDELIVLKELYNVRCTLRGKALVKFDFLMDSLKEKDESIEELEYQLDEKERRFNLLRQELKTERCISQGLKQQIETYELDKVKDLETIDRAQSLTQVLHTSKEELEVAHASLTRDLDHLERANKLVKDELKKLGENHDLLQETYMKALESMKDPIVVEKHASSPTSFTSEHAKLVEEHVRLQEELSLHIETNAYLESLVTKYGLDYHPNESSCEHASILEENVRLTKELAKFTFAKKAQRMYESEIKAIRTDNGTEFKNYTMQEFVDDEGIKHEFSAPYTPQQNGVVERKNRTIIEMARTMLSEFNSPHNFWGEAISTAVHYSNRLFLRPLHNKTPYELLTGNKPNVTYIRVFGCKCLVKNNKGKLGKFETRTIEGIFVGYAENSHAYRYYNRSSGTIEVSCDVVFLEDNGSQVEQVVPCVAGNDDDPSSAIKHMGIGHIRPMEVHNDDQDDGVDVSSTPQVEPSSTQAEPSSATQEPSSTQDESQSEEQEEDPHSMEQDHDDDQETSSTHDQAQVVPHDQVLARDEFIDHEGTVRKIKAATRAKLKFFLGFQVRQLAKGTFISQEKYVKDMLKKFNMTNASPMKTPMPVKGQLGSCDGEKDVDIKVVGVVSHHVAMFPREEGLILLAVLVAASPQAQQGTDIGSSARGRTKSVATKHKDKHVAHEDDEVVPTINVGAANRLEWQEWRTVNPYRFEKPTYTRSDRAFWTNTQAALWEGFYDSHEFMKHGNIVSPKAINPDELALHEATKYRFVVQTLKNLGLYDLVCLKPDDTQDDPTFCPLLVRQFHCTVFFHDDEDRTLTWMTGKTKYSCSYSQFRAAMGCGDDSNPGYRIHSRSRLTKGDISFCYPANPTPGPPTISGMYYSYLVLAKLFRENLISKSGDHSEVRNYHLNLMYYCHPDRVRKIDGCDLIYCELKRAIMDRMTPNYAQYVQRLINYIVPAPRNVIGEKVIMDPSSSPLRRPLVQTFPP
ncbi:hypothetical protein QYE76_021447 [Lolium multiflorum]|uniref:Uncharacterized protein n=1 Tax=Lolium multiflorum TaxID=4521 RepID=A0AAD8R6R8_LOLMU|nr:hypothetical protein QYE76_021447 [Lolium multiflorum]